jgi:hypothetical protein
MGKRELIADLRTLHALFNILIVLFFVLQAWLGFSIRRRRRAGMSVAVRVVKFHRKAGPLLVLAGTLGFVSGLTLAYIDNGYLFRYALHAVNGIAIAVLLVTNYYVSMKIRGAESEWRTVHYGFGLLIISLYGVQSFLGAGIFL